MRPGVPGRRACARCGWAAGRWRARWEGSGLYSEDQEALERIKQGGEVARVVSKDPLGEGIAGVGGGVKGGRREASSLWEMEVVGRAVAVQVDAVTNKLPRRQQ